MFGMVFALSCVISAAAENDTGKPELIGIAIKSVVFGNSHAVLARSPEGQPDMFYIPFYSTTGSALVGYHSRTGEMASVKLGSSGGYGCCVGTDGALYIGGVNPGDMYRYDPAEKELTDLGKVIRVGGQVDSICTGHDGKVYMGAYVLAHLAVYDPAKPWEPGRDRESNPWELGAIGHGQYRTCAIALGPHGNIWVGSIPSYNSGPTGAFSRWNPDSGEHATWTDLVPGGAVHHIAVDERYVYCAGGGVFFVWDPVANKKVHEEKRATFSLVTTPNGMVVASGGKEMFVFDPERMKVVGAFPSPIGRLDTMTVAPNGKLYGINASALCEIEPGTWAGRKICDEGGKFLAADSESSLYFARGSKLYRLRLAAKP